LAALLALGASLSWGVGDFVGGFKTRRLGTLAVLFISQPPTLLLIAAVVIIRDVPLVPGPWIAAGVVAGLAGLVGLSAVYRGMAIGVVGVVSTIAATGPVIPILVGLVLGERPSVLQFVGILVTLAGNHTIELLHGALQQVMDRAGLLRAVTGMPGADTGREVGARAHRRLVELLEQRDIEAVGALWVRHIEQTSHYLEDADGGPTPLHLLS